VKFRIAASVVIAAALALAGCTSGSNASSENSNTFEFWAFSGINEKASVADYTKQHPNIHIKLTEVGSSTETAQALTTALAGGKVPDLVLIQGDDLPKFVAQPQNFVDLRSLGADKIKGNYLDWIISQSTTKGGGIIGVPTDVGGMAIAYRKDLFAAAGLPTDPAAVGKLWPTWDQFIETGKRYTAATHKPFLDNAETSVFYQAVNQGPEKYYDSNHQLAYDKSPQVHNAFNLALKTIAAGISANQTSFTSGWSAGMTKGQFAVVAAPSWMLNTIRTTAPQTTGMWDIATIPGGAGNWGGSYLAIPKNAKNPQAAWNYITATQSPQGQLSHFVESGALPTTPSVYQDPKLTSLRDPFFSNAPTGIIYTSSLLGLKPFYIGPDSAAIGQEFLNAITNVEQGKGAAGQAWNAALQNIKNSIGH
jgi:cellobiose transport system substrate-binding protein